MIAIILNGLATYAAWCSIATLLNVNIVLAYIVDIELHIASSIALGEHAFFILNDFKYCKLSHQSSLSLFIVLYFLLVSGALALDILVYAVVDLVLFEKHFRYVYTPYIVLAVALTGSLEKNWDSANSNTIFTVAICCMAAILFCVKFVMSIVRSRSHPVF